MAVFLAISMPIAGELAAEAPKTASIALTVATPYVDAETSAVVLGVSYTGENLTAGRYGMRVFQAGDTETTETNYALTGLSAQAGMFRLSGAIVEFPGYSGKVSIEKTTAGVLSTGLGVSIRDFSCTALLSGVFLPEIPVTIQGNEAAMRSSVLPGFVGVAWYRDFFVAASRFEGAWNGEIEHVKVGKANVTVTAVSAGWRDFGVFYGVATGDAAFAAKALVTRSIGFTGEATGNADIRVGGGWGKASFNARSVRGGLWAAVAALEARDTYARGKYTIDSKLQQDAHYGVSWNPAVVFLAKAYLDYRLTGSVTLALERWFWYQSENLPAKNNAIANGVAVVEEGPHALSGDSMPDWQTALFAGASLSARIKIR